MKNLSFEDGWRDLPPAGDLINQEPLGWSLNILPVGGRLWDSNDKAHGIPECVHKHVTQLPANEQPDGPDALILDGEYVYKIFHASAAFGAELTQSVSGLLPGSRVEIVIPVQVHRHGDGDLYAAEVGAWLNEDGGWTPVDLLQDREWIRRVLSSIVPDDGIVTVRIRVKSKWDKGKDFFIDAIEWRVEAENGDDGPPPPDTDAIAELQRVQAEHEARLSGIEARLDTLENGDDESPLGNNLIDMSRYFLPENGWRGPVYIMSNNWGQGDERMQLQADGLVSWVTKNSQWERRRITDDAIFLEMDTSPGNDEYYTATGPWLPRFWQPDSSFVREQTVTFRRKSDCQPVRSKPAYTMASEMRFLAHYPSWTTPNGSVTLMDVIEVTWLVNGNVDETYWYAAGIGLVHWRKYNGMESVIVAIYSPGEQEDNVREVIHCA